MAQPPARGQSGVWVTKAPMPTGRSSLMVGVVNGVVYAIGGRRPAAADTIYETVEAYDPKTDTWVTRAPLPVPCWGTGAAAISGIIYVVGCGPSTYAYDPGTNTWTARAPMPTPRSP
jgi:N-acetylneuraminic acid mutarotase